jgi:hypothetical protein
MLPYKKVALEKGCFCSLRVPQLVQHHHHDVPKHDSTKA